MSTKIVPVKTGSKAKKSAVSKTMGPELTKAKQRSGKRILVVDDEAMFAMMCKKTLTKVGFEVTAMTDAGEALKRFESHSSSFDVVIADKTMPKLGGYELARKLLEIRPGIPVVIASGYKEESHEATIKSANVRAYAKKPISIIDLVRIIDTVLGESL